MKCYFFFLLGMWHSLVLCNSLDPFLQQLKEEAALLSVIIWHIKFSLNRRDRERLLLKLGWTELHVSSLSLRLHPSCHPLRQ